MSDRFAIPICRHLKTNGVRCQSPALNGEPFCYFHVRLHRQHPVPPTAREIIAARNLQFPEYEDALIGAGEDPMQIARAYPDQNELHFPPLEDAESIQFATSVLFHALAQGQVHLSRARLLRDLLRVATVSCRLNKPNPDATCTAVRDIDRTAEGIAIAPADESPESANVAPVETGTPEPLQPSPELTSNQDFTCNTFCNNILPDTVDVSPANSRS